MHGFPASSAKPDLPEPGDTAAELTALIEQQIGEMPPQLQVAARFVLERPQDVALMSMRVQAQAAGVSHSTMMRLAEWLGLSGYAALRQAFAGSFRKGAMTSRLLHPDERRKSDIAAGIASSITLLAESSLRAHLSAAADRLKKSERIICVGSPQEVAIVRRAEQLFAALGADVETFVSGDWPKPASRHSFRHCLLAISLSPHRQLPANAVTAASRSGMPVVAITNDRNSTVAKLADTRIVLLPTMLTPTIPSLTCAIAAVEAIAFLWEEQTKPRESRR